MEFCQNNKTIVPNKDWLHSYLMNTVVKKLDSEKVWRIEKRDLSETIELQVEKGYNKYGDRGFVDVYHLKKQVDWGDSIITVLDLWEIKPVLTDLGEAIRQLNRAKNSLSDNVDRTYTRLGFFNISENFEVIVRNWDILTHVDPWFALHAYNPFHPVNDERDYGEYVIFPSIYTQLFAENPKRSPSEHLWKLKEYLFNKNRLSELKS